MCEDRECDVDGGMDGVVALVSLSCSRLSVCFSLRLVPFLSAPGLAIVALRLREALLNSSQKAATSVRVRRC